MGIVENAIGFFKPNSVLGPIAPILSSQSKREYLDNRGRKEAVCQAAMGPKLPLREEHSQDSSRKEHAMEKRLAAPQKARNAGLPQQDGVGPPPGHDERLFGVGGVESWSRRRPTVPCEHALSRFRSPQSSVHPNFVSGVSPSG